MTKNAALPVLSGGRRFCVCGDLRGLAGIFPALKKATGKNSRTGRARLTGYGLCFGVGFPGSGGTGFPFGLLRRGTLPVDGGGGAAVGSDVLLKIGELLLGRTPGDQQQAGVLVHRLAAPTAGAGLLAAGGRLLDSPGRLTSPGLLAGRAFRLGRGGIAPAAAGRLLVLGLAPGGAGRLLFGGGLAAPAVVLPRGRLGRGLLPGGGGGLLRLRRFGGGLLGSGLGSLAAPAAPTAGGRADAGGLGMFIVGA